LCELGQLKGTKMFDITRDSAGLIARVFVKDPSTLPSVVGHIEELVTNALALKQSDGKSLYRHIALVVTADRRFPDHDACNTHIALRRMIAQHSKDSRWSRSVFVEVITQGDPFCFALNRGMRLLSRRAVTHATIISFGVRKYLTQKLVDETFGLFNRGASVVGCVLPELRESIEQGRIANTLATWSIDELADVGFFSFFGRQHQLVGATHTIQSTEVKGSIYRLQGTEEIVPLCWQAMARTKDLDSGEKVITPFIGLVYPDVGVRWEVIDGEREERKMGTKEVRQIHQALVAGADLSILEAAVLAECRALRSK